MFLFQKIEETMMKYTDARHAVGEFIIKEQENLYKYTISEIAERTYTSKATVVRFAKSMGYDGWREFMKDYIEEVQYKKRHESSIDYNFPFKEGDDRNTIINNLLTLQVESLKETADLIDEGVLNKAVERIANARNIVVFGTSPNVYFGEIFKRKMYTIGKMVTVVTHGESGIIATSLDSRDCAIIISYSGNSPTKSPLDKIKILKKNNVPLIGITSGGSNYMRNNIDCILTITSRERLYTKISNFSTEESINFIFNVLYSCLFAKNYKQNKNYKICNSKLLEQERNTQINEIKDND